MKMGVFHLNSLFMIKRKKNQCLFAVLFFSVMILIPHFTLAATFIVNSTTDAVDANPGDGICASVGGICTLRAAIMEANALAGADIITLPAGTYTLTIAGTGEDAAATGDLDIIDDLTINGAGSATTVINGNNLDRIFDIRNGVVTISGVTIRGGNPANDGGGILMRTDLAIYNVSLILTNSVVSNNSATNGGGIFELSGSLMISDSIINGNTSTGIGGGIFNNTGTIMTLTNVTVGMNVAEGDAGGIYNGGSATLNSVTINSNVSSAEGGGIFNNGTETMTNTTISANSATIMGGGIINFTEGTITNSTISGNSTTNQGGGIFTGGTLLLTNVTISSNDSGIGGGIFSFGTETLINVTINGNNAGDGGGIFNSLQTVSLRNSIITDNLGSNCSGAVTSLGHNLENGNTCGFTGPGDLSNSNPLLGPLANNGGPTMTHALLPGSPAIDAADPTTFPPTDQRGVSRPQGAAPDIGAYELVPTLATTVSVPTMTEWGMIIFMVLAAVASLHCLRRHRGRF